MAVAGNCEIIPTPSGWEARQGNWRITVNNKRVWNTAAEAIEYLERHGWAVVNRDLLTT